MDNHVICPKCSGTMDLFHTDAPEDGGKKYYQCEACLSSAREDMMFLLKVPSKVTRLEAASPEAN